jgi:hypothetical protein
VTHPGRSRRTGLGAIAPVRPRSVTSCWPRSAEAPAAATALRGAFFSDQKRCEARAGPWPWPARRLRLPLRLPCWERRASSVALAAPLLTARSRQQQSQRQGGGPLRPGRAPPPCICAAPRLARAAVIRGMPCGPPPLSLLLRQLCLPLRGVRALTSSELPWAVPDGPT